MRIEKTKLATDKETYKLLAEDGKVLMRKSDGTLFGDTLVLGYVWYLAGVKLLDEDGNPSPHWEVPEDYTEVDKPEEPDEDDEKEEEEIPYEPIEDLTELERLRKEKLKALDKYDKSSEVNCFYVGDTPAWIDRETRVSLMNNCAIFPMMGRESIDLWLGTEQYDMPIGMLKQMLAALEMYAFECYNKTAEHKAAIMSLETFAEIAEYDFTYGYPEKIHFTL